MGACSCTDSSIRDEDSRVNSIPKPAIFHSTNFVFLNYTQVSQRVESFGKLKQNLIDCVITKLVRYEYSTEEWTESIIYIEGIGVNNIHKAMLVEVVDGSVLIQYGCADAIESIIRPHEPHILTQHKPSLIRCENNLIYLIEKLYEIAQTQRFQSTKATMRRLRSLLES